MKYIINLGIFDNCYVLKLSVTCIRSVVFSCYAGFLHQQNWLPGCAQ